MLKPENDSTGLDHAETPSSMQDGAEENISAGSGANISRRAAVGRLAFFGAVMSALSARALAQQGASGSYSNAAVAMLPAGESSAQKTTDDVTRGIKIARAMRSGPPEITRDATVAEMDHTGNITEILQKGTNGWLCVPGDENRIGDPPMCVDDLGMQWFKDAFTGQPHPTNKAGDSATCCAAPRSTATPISMTGRALRFRSARTG